MISSWKKVSSKIVYQSPYFEIYEDEVVTPDGRKSIYYKDKTRDAVAIVALDKNKNIYLIKEDKYITGLMITLPAGVIEKGETPLLSAKRELKEEVGLEAKRWQNLGYFWASPGRSDLKGWVFLAEDLIEGEQKLDGGEKIEVVKVPFKKVIEMIKKGEIIDAWAIIPIFKVKLFLRL